MRSKDFVKILRLLAGLAALILTASAASATVIDLRAALGPSGHYTSRAYYRSLLGGQPMTAAQQAYAGFMGLGFMGWRARQKTGAGPLLRRVRGYHQGCQLRPQRQQSQ